MTTAMVVVQGRRSRRYPWGQGDGRDQNGKKTDDCRRACLAAVENDNDNPVEDDDGDE